MRNLSEAFTSRALYQKSSTSDGSSMFAGWLTVKRQAVIWRTQSGLCALINERVEGFGEVQVGWFCNFKSSLTKRKRKSADSGHKNPSSELVYLGEGPSHHRHSQLVPSQEEAAALLSQQSPMSVEATEQGQQGRGKAPT